MTHARTEPQRSAAFAITTAVALQTPKHPDANEDRVRVFACAEELGGGAGVVVCDGVGSLAGSGDVADRVASFVADHVTALGLADGVASCAEAARDHLKDITEGATTLLAAGADPAGRVRYAFVGNGSLFDIEPTEFPDGSVRLRVAELVVPHMTLITGRPALRSFLPTQGELEVTTGTIDPRPGRERLVLVCTDGVASDEERGHKIDSNDDLWRVIPKPLVGLLDHLTRAWRDIHANPRRDPLEATIQAALDDAHAAGDLDDDAGVGAVLLSPVSTA
jgi:hypothetical protein